MVFQFAGLWFGEFIFIVLLISLLRVADTPVARGGIHTTIATMIILLVAATNKMIVHNPSALFIPVISVAAWLVLYCMGNIVERAVTGMLMRARQRRGS